MAKFMFVYILQCADGTFYTGVTNDMERRVAEHEEGLDNTAYTYSRRPVTLVYHEMFLDPKEAINYEKKIKGWSKAKKIALIENRWDDLPRLSECKNSTNYKNKKVE